MSEYRLDVDAGLVDAAQRERAATTQLEENKRLRAALQRIRTGGSTSLYDGYGCASIAEEALSASSEGGAS